jgi:hypothetical protein
MAVKKPPADEQPFADESDPEAMQLESEALAAKREQAEIVQASATVERSVAIRSEHTNREISTTELKELNLNQLIDALGVSEVSDVIPTDQYGPVLEDKAKLCGVPFMLVHWEFHGGDFGEFVSMWVLTLDDKRYIVNDGSTGIYQQLKETTGKHNIDSMLVCRHGLRESKYTYTGPDGKERPASTFYIDNRL